MPEMASTIFIWAHCSMPSPCARDGARSPKDASPGDWRGARWGCRSAALAAFAVELLRADHLRRVLRFLVGGDLPDDDLAVEREGLQHDVEAAVVLVREHE